MFYSYTTTPIALSVLRLETWVVTRDSMAYKAKHIYCLNCHCVWESENQTVLQMYVIPGLISPTF